MSDSSSRARSAVVLLTCCFGERSLVCLFVRLSCTEICVDACQVEGRGRSRVSRGLCCAYRLVGAPLLVAKLTPLVVWTRIVLSIHGSCVLSGHRILCAHAWKRLPRVGTWSDACLNMMLRRFVWESPETGRCRQPKANN